MKLIENLKSLWQDKIIRPALILAILLIIFSFSFFIFHFHRLPPEVPLFYSRPWGQEQLALPWQPGLLPLLSLMFFAIDLILATQLHEQHPFLSQLLAWTTAVFSLLTTITLVKIITLIT